MDASHPDRGTARIELDKVPEFAEKRTTGELEQIIKMVKSDMVNVKKDYERLAEDMLCDLEDELDHRYDG